jgi:hypothetical protein
MPPMAAATKCTLSKAKVAGSIIEWGFPLDMSAIFAEADKVILRAQAAQPPAQREVVPAALHNAGIIPHFYIQRRVNTLPAFANHHRFGARRAIEDALRSLADGNYILEIKPTTLNESYGFGGKAYVIKSVD